MPPIPSQDFIEAAYIQPPRCISGTITLNYWEKLEITDELDCHQTKSGQHNGCEVLDLLFFFKLRLPVALRVVTQD